MDLNIGKKEEKKKEEKKKEEKKKEDIKKEKKMEEIKKVIQQNQTPIKENYHYNQHNENKPKYPPIPKPPVPKHEDTPKAKYNKEEEIFKAKMDKVSKDREEYNQYIKQKQEHEKNIKKLQEYENNKKQQYEHQKQIEKQEKQEKQEKHYEKQNEKKNEKIYEKYEKPKLDYDRPPIDYNPIRREKKNQYMECKLEDIFPSKVKTPSEHQLKKQPSIQQESRNNKKRDTRSASKPVAKPKEEKKTQNDKEKEKLFMEKLKKDEEIRIKKTEEDKERKEKQILKEKEIEQKKKQRDEERKKMLEDIKHKKKPNTKKDELTAVIANTKIGEKENTDIKDIQHKEENNKQENNSPANNVEYQHQTEKTEETKKEDPKIEEATIVQSISPNIQIENNNKSQETEKKNDKDMVKQSETIEDKNSEDTKIENTQAKQQVVVDHKAEGEKSLNVDSSDANSVSTTVEESKKSVNESSVPSSAQNEQKKLEYEKSIFEAHIINEVQAIEKDQLDYNKAKDKAEAELDKYYKKIENVKDEYKLMCYEMYKLVNDADETDSPKNIDVQDQENINYEDRDDPYEDIKVNESEDGKELI